jgi:hypothetical protein
MSSSSTLASSKDLYPTKVDLQRGERLVNMSSLSLHAVAHFTFVQYDHLCPGLQKTRGEIVEGQFNGENIERAWAAVKSQVCTISTTFLQTRPTDITHRQNYDQYLVILRGENHDQYIVVSCGCWKNYLSIQNILAYYHIRQIHSFHPNRIRRAMEVMLMSVEKYCVDLE